MSSIFMRFPGGRKKALTLSYDDGVEQDIRLIQIMKKNGLKGTFNLNSGLYAPEGTVYPKGELHRVMSRKQCREVYRDSNVEVAVHGLTHPHLEQLPSGMCAYEIVQDRVNLEEDFECIVKGMAYPFGTTSDEVTATLKQCGIVYARTVESTGRFDIPSDWLRLPATCRHADPRLMELAHDFVENDRKKAPELFYLWGHSYEFERDDNWYVMEEFAEYVGNRKEIWYATNGEIYDYIYAYNQLRFSANGKQVYNPTDTILYFEKEGIIISIEPGETKQWNL